MGITLSANPRTRVFYHRAQVPVVVCHQNLCPYSQMSVVELTQDGHSSSTSPPTKKRKLGGLECGLENSQTHTSVAQNGSEKMAQNGNGVTSNGTENGSGGKGIDEGLYSRQ